ncbi:hypothetical protein JXA40_05730 [bacterium]|nr:hypothetical protein [candidate division CSSED10-310 bacterium]
MTKILKKAFDEVSKLPIDLQNQIAQELIDEIEWEMKWDETLENSSDFLEHLANSALNDFERGQTLEKGIDEL